MVLGLALVVTATLAAACTSRPSVEEVVDQSTPVICDKSKECSGAAFDIAYPAGVNECVTKTKAEVSKKYGNDLNRSSVCDDDQLDKCLEDFKKATCGAGGKLPALPCNC